VAPSLFDGQHSPRRGQLLDALELLVPVLNHVELRRPRRCVVHRARIIRGTLFGIQRKPATGTFSSSSS
jgi:hypothetical protein